MQLIINGEQREMPGVATVTDVLATLELDPRAVVVERNRVIVRRAELADTAVAEGDTIEIVHFVGGG